MDSVKKWLTERSAQKNGLYVHYSPPKLVGVVSAAQLRQWARGGAENKLERAVLAGQGRRLLAEAEALPLAHHLPALVAKCDALHTAVERGSLLDLQELLESDYNRRKYVLCRDEAGVGLLHKAVFYDYMDIVEYLAKNYPQLVHQKDSEGRTPLHYAAVCRDEAGAAAVLEGAGAARGARDAAGRTPAGYRGAARTLLALPTTADMARETAKNPPGLVIKRHNIRIWCHDCDMARLQRVVWEGHGSRLLSEVSSQHVVKKFLEAVPYIMNTVKDIHTSVVQNDLEGLMKHAGDPVPPQALSSRDIHNMTVMHKAAGLGHVSIMKYIAERYPQGINDVDNDGRTPLHYAAAMRDDQHTYDTLVGLGADESALDNKNKTPGYYVNRPQEIDKTLFKTIPEAPRTASSAYPSSWDWKLLDNDVITDLNKKSRRKHLRVSTENLSSKNNTNTISESTDNQTGVMKASSTHEFIKDLPELEEKDLPEPNDSNTANENDSGKPDEPIESNEETQSMEEIHEKKENTGEEDANNMFEEISHETEKGVENDQEHAEGSIEETENPAENVEEITETNDKDMENKLETVEHKAELDDSEIANAENSAVPKYDKNEENQAKSDVEEKNEAVDTESGEAENEDMQISKIEDKQENNDQESENHTVTDNIDPTDKATEDSEHVSSEQDDVKERSNGEHNSNPNDHVTDEHNQKDEKTFLVSAEAVEDLYATTNEGNSNNEHNEDDDDVQVQGDNVSEYSESNLKSTAEISDSGSAKRGNVTNGRNTQESLIEGIISNEAEQNSQDATITHRDSPIHADLFIVDSEIDPEVTDLINNANMEMLASLVLNGEGSRLIGRRSGNTELQAFLDNVSTYMQKINKVHLAAKEGNIRDLQAALDRRKFAIARDPVSANGATPLHVATVFGKTSIMKYLGGRFPETLSAVDFEGRTALHYAAILPDNGHYYNLLQQLGANSKDLDDNGKSAEDYFKNPCLLPFDQLLSDFGMSDEEVKSMFSDKGSRHAANGHMDIPIFRTEEGRYLAKSLGDPLIKGLTEVANVKPKDPVAFLASFLQNFPDNEKPQIDTQESDTLVAENITVMENEQPPPEEREALAPAPPANGLRNGARTATRPHRPIDVVTVDPQAVVSPDAPETAFSSANRDEHGQSMLHFAAARTHARNALFQLLQESEISLGFRDELYRTARDVSIQANVPENTTEIDKWVLHLAARGNTEKIMELLFEGYDHILDVIDENAVPITEVISQRGDSEMSNLLASIPAFEESRESLHAAVRRGDLAAVQELLTTEGGKTLAGSQNSFGRTALHVAVLAQQEEIVAYLAQTFPELLRIGDNLERSPLHYAMGVDKMESLSRVLIRAGSKRVLKDLKGRQPSYYFMNKSDILRLKEEEEVY